MTAIPSGLEPVVAWLLRVSVQAAVLICLVGLVQAVCGNRLAARWRYALWLLVVGRLLLPVSLPSRLSLFNLNPLRAMPEAVGAAPSAVVPSDHGRGDAAQPAPSPSEVTLRSSASSGPAQSATTVAPVPGEKRHSFFLPWWEWFALVWLTGVVLLGLRIVVQNVRFYLRLRWEPTVTEAGAWSVLDECRQLMGVRYRLVLVETVLVQSPALYGFLRLHLLLPAKTLAAFSPTELRYVFLHELAHVKRRDMLVNWFITVLQVVHWFNPLVWLAFRRMVADRELAADALALSRLEVRENIAYGNAIIKLLQSLLRPAPLPGLVGILEDKSQMKRRMTMITQFRKTNQRPLLALLVMVGLALIALTDARSQSTRGPAKLNGQPAADLAVLRVWGNIREYLALSVGVSSDGRYFSYTDGATGDLMVRDLFEGNNRRLTQTPPSQYWKTFAASSIPSPDGSQIAYVSWSKGTIQLRLVDRESAKSRLLYEQKSDGWMDLSGWSGDGQQLLAWSQPGNGTAQIEVALFSVADGSRRLVAMEDPAGADRLTLTPDGRFLAYNRKSPTNERSREIFVMPVAGGTEIPLVQGPWENRNMGWSPDGRQLLFLSNRRGSYDCWTLRVEDGKAQGDPELLKANLGRVTPMGVTRSGGFYYLTDVSSTEVQVAKLDLTAGSLAGPPRSIAQYQGRNSEPHWSPDGKQLAYLSVRDNASVLCVYTMETGQQRDYPPPIGSSNPAWSADGKSIRLRTGSGIFSLDLATGDATPMNLDGFFLFPATDETVAFRRIMQSPQQILKKDLRTGQETVLYKFAANEGFGWGWMLSPNAQQLAVGVVREGWTTLQAIPVAGGQPRELLRAAHPPLRYCWLPDSRQLLCFIEKEWSMVSIDGQAPQPLPLNQNWTDFDMNPDGQQLAFVTSTNRAELWLMENAVPPSEAD